MMNTTKVALKEQEAEMLKQFNVEELEERLEMAKWSAGDIDTDYVCPDGTKATAYGACLTIDF